MTPARVRFTGFLARNYRARSFTLAHSDGWWVCEIDKSGKFRNRIDQLARHSARGTHCVRCAEGMV